METSFDLSNWKDVGMEGWIACGKCNLHLIVEDAQQYGCCGKKYLENAGEKEQQEENEEVLLNESTFSLMRLLLKYQNWGDDPAEIVPKVYLGSMLPSQDMKLLQKLSIEYVLNMAEELPNAFPDSFNYLKISLSDEPTTNIAVFFEASIAFIVDAKYNGVGILVHCAAGASRSVSIVLAYLMKEERMTFKEAFRHTKQKRIGICPNRGFLQQLLNYEKSIFGKNSMSLTEACALY